MVGQVIAVVVILVTFGLVGVLAAFRPHVFESIRKRFPGYMESPVWWTRAIGALVFTCAVGVAVALFVTA